MLFQRLAAASDKIPQAQHDEHAALHVVAAALSCDVTEGMTANASHALFAEATRLLFAVLGFSCEGFYPPALRGRALSRAAQSVIWPSIAPQALLGQWFNLPALLSIFGGAPIRNAFDKARKKHQAQFICGLSRAAFLEVGHQEARHGRLLRAPWAKIFDQFPEIRMVRDLYTYVRRRCWEDVRDRSRSRSRSRERKKKNDQNKGYVLPPSCVRFFVKGCGRLSETHLESHFSKFGSIYECTILYDKKTQKSRGMSFLTLKPEGSWRGKKNTPQMMREWVLETPHVVGGLQLEVSVAEEKQAEDEEKKREERIDDRRLQRLEREQRLGRDGSGEERLVISPWAGRWRQEIAERLPKEFEGPAAWSTPSVVGVCCRLWGEIADYIRRMGSPQAQEALGLFQAEQAGGAVQWAFVPAADVLLLVGDGLVGITAEGVFANSIAKEPAAPPPGFDHVSLKTVHVVVPAVKPLPLSAVPAAPTTAFTSGDGRLQRGGSDREKVFVGGLTQSTTLDMLMGHGQTTRFWLRRL